jgi:cobalt-zinc-cadmium efflux system outer membrane protein
MYTRCLAGLLLAAMLPTGMVVPQEQQPPIREITFEQALELARFQSPALEAARARVGEAVGGLDAAQVWRFNPELEAESGPRYGTDRTTTDWSFGARQWFETGGRRRLRLDAAHAGVAAEEARAAESARVLLREVALAFAGALYWRERADLASRDAWLMEEIARVARRRHETGQTGGLEPSLSTLALDRARIAETLARAELTREKVRLMTLLGLETEADIALAGDLRDLGLQAGSGNKANVERRPEMQALAAEIQRAAAEADLGRAGRWPDVGLGVSWEREGEADLVHGHLVLALPLFDRGQGTVALAEARRLRIEAELRGVRRRVLLEVERARQMSRQLRDAALLFEGSGLPALERSERLATANYEAGAIPLTELLAVRRELVQASIDYAELLHGAAIARIELAAGTGEYQ